jgi:membrane-associated phospholipid phosphatase
VAGLLFNEFHPRSDRRKWIWIGGCTLATSTGILRVISGNHFPTDAMVGAVAGCLTGYFIHFLNH